MKSMVHRATALLTFATLIFTLVACGGQEAPRTDGPVHSMPAEAASGETAAPALSCDAYSHVFENGACTLCGEAAPEELSTVYFEAPETALDDLFRHTLWPAEYYEPAQAGQQGEIVSVSYETYAYEYYYDYEVDETEWELIPKRCFVYLPAGYDAALEYNVYYMLHGAGGDETSFFSADGVMGAGLLVNWLDNMIASGEIEPLIVVTPTIRLDGAKELESIRSTKWNTGYEVKSFKWEFEFDLVPAVESQFSTYAASTDQASLAASRHHRAVSGFSQGGTVVYHTLQGTLDVAAYYGPFANGISLLGDGSTPEQTNPLVVELMDTLDSREYAGYGIGFLYAQNGTADQTHNTQVHTLQAMLDYGAGRLAYGENMYFTDIRYGTHSYEYCCLAIYNSLQVFFQ